MTDTSGTSTLMQRLLAECYQNERYDFASYPPQQSINEQRTELNVERSVNAFTEDSPYVQGTFARMTVGQQSQPEICQSSLYPDYVVSESDPAARLDALCRSTLDKSPNLNGSHQSIGNTTPMYPTDPRMPSSGRAEDPHKSQSHSASFETLSRLRNQLKQKCEEDKDSERINRILPSYLEAKTEAKQMRVFESSYRKTGNAILSPRCNVHEVSTPVHGLGSRSFPMVKNDQTQTNVIRPDLQLHGHPKSNSGGDEYLYTDQLKQNSQRRGIRSKKNKSGVGRSRSFRHNPQEVDLNFNLDSSLPLKQTMKEQAISDFDELSSWRSSGQAKHVSSRSAPSQNSGRETLFDQRRASLHGNLLDVKEGISSDLSRTSETHPQQIKSNTPSNCEMLQNNPTMPQAPALGNTGGYVRGGYVPSGFYGNNPPVVNPNLPASVSEGNPTPPIMNTLRGNSPPRPPPPPYPVGYSDVDSGRGQGPEVDSKSWHPQRPKSLALGNSSKKKTANNNALIQNSPCVTSPAASRCYSPSVRGTPFCGHVPYTNTSGQMHVSSSNTPQQRPNNGSSSYLGRSGSGNNFPNLTPIGTPSSSGSSTCTGATTPYQDPLSYVDTGLRSPVSGSQFHISPQGFVPESYASPGNGVNKSESINSSSSSVGACRIGRRKRNNSSKIGYGSSSGSSSNSGSRPNSTADLTERLETENENLRTQLEMTIQKLRKYETLELELMKINQSHQALQQTAQNKERLEKEIQNRLKAKLEKVEKERNGFENQVHVLSQQLKDMSMTSSKDDANDVTKENNMLGLCDIKAQKSSDRERELEEELEECREKISEYKVDIQLLTSSLHKAQATITVLKEKFLQTNNIDAYTKELTERLASLQKIVDERQEVERELRDRTWKQLQTQRPFKSTSSNDEGISEMDPPDSLTANAVDLYSGREGQMLGTKAEMLKWQHRYLEEGLLKHVYSNGSETMLHKRIYKALRSHRHAVSDPGFDKNPLMKTVLLRIGGSGNSSSSSGTLYEQDDATSFRRNNSSLTEMKTTLEPETDLSNGDNPPNFSTESSTADCACQTPTSNWILGYEEKPQCEKVHGETQTVESKITATDHSACSSSVVERDSPSEGYHSQQSSGSPTPNVEKNTPHFSGPIEHPLTPNSRVIPSTVIRRNKSADVLTTAEI